MNSTSPAGMRRVAVVKGSSRLSRDTSNERNSFRNKIRHTPYPNESVHASDRASRKRQDARLHKIAKRTPFKSSRVNNRNTGIDSSKLLFSDRSELDCHNSSCLHTINRFISKNKGRITLEYIRVSSNPSDNSLENMVQNDDSSQREIPSLTKMSRNINDDLHDTTKAFSSANESTVLHKEVMRNAVNDSHQHSAILASSRNTPLINTHLTDENSNWGDIEAPFLVTKQRSFTSKELSQSSSNNDGNLYLGGPEHRRWLAKVYGRKEMPNYRRKIRVSGIFKSQLNRFRDSLKQAHNEVGNEQLTTMSASTAEGFYNHKFDVGMRMLLDKTTKDVNFKLTFNSKSKTPKIQVMQITVDGNPIWRQRKLQSSAN